MLIDTLLSIIRERRSIREFTAEEISPEEVRMLVEAARFAPSNSNRQAWKFLAVKNRKIKVQMVEAVQGKLQQIQGRINDPEHQAMFADYSRYLTFFADAPLVIVALYKKSPLFLETLLGEMEAQSAEDFIPPEGFSVAMAVQNLLLAAHALGLGACCTTGPLIAAREFRKILEIPPAFSVAALIPVGRFVHLPSSQSRKPVEQILEFIP